jgi:ATP-binding cassette subfamily B protein
MPKRAARRWPLARRAGAVFALSFRASPGHTAAGLAIMLASGLLPAAATWCTKLVVDGVTAGQTASVLLWLALGLAGAGLVAATAPYLNSYLDGELGRRVDLRLQERLYSAVNGFGGLSRFEDPAFRDKLSLATQATGNSLSGATGGVLAVGRDAIALGTLLGTMWLLAPLMAALVLVAGVPVLVAQIWLSRRNARAMETMSPASRRQFFFASLITDAQAAKEVRMYDLGAFLRHRLMGGLRSVQGVQRGMDRQELGVRAGLALLSAVVSGGGLLWAVWAAGRGRLTPGDITAFIAAMAGTQAAVGGMVSGIAGMYQALLTYGHYEDVVEAPNDLPAAPDHANVAPLRHGIELRDVWFRYADNLPWVLRGVTMTIPYGATVGLVGLNGQGKSTLVKLLCRFYEPTRGSIRWDGVDLRDLPVTQLRQRMSVLFQDFMCYDLTAEENIAIGDLHHAADRSRVELAARAANVHEVLQALPRGYDTMLSRLFFPDDGSDGGVLLSGGQWQRVALARTLLRDGRDLLILDEPSAGLDAESEYEIHRRLRAYRAGRTSLLISHRLGTLRDADLIVVLDGGRVAEVGPPDTLLSIGGAYARLFALQAENYQAVPAP